MKHKKRTAIAVLSILMVLSGILLILYPFISNRLYEEQVDSTIQVYENRITELDENTLIEQLERARLYNEALSKSQVTLTDPFVLQETEEDQDLEYEGLLNTDNSGILCFLEIPRISIYLPVYHGTDAEVLMKGIGHIEGSSLPIGGIGNHTVLSGHTGLDKAKLFTDLTELEQGDLFFIHVLNQTLAYRVTAIHVIEPSDTSRLTLKADRDLVSLLTCTPYGVNTHRLVVTGERTEYTETIREEAEQETGESTSQWRDAYKRALLIGVFSAVAVILALRMIRGFIKCITEKRRSRMK